MTRQEMEKKKQAGELFKAAMNSSAGIREFTTPMSMVVEDMMKDNGAVGLVDYESLKKLREEALEKRQKALEGGADDEMEANFSDALETKVIENESSSKLKQKKKKPTKSQRSKLSFEDEETENNEESDNAVVRKKRKVDQSVDTSFLKTKEEEEWDRKQREELRKEFLKRQLQVKDETVNLRFVYFDGTSTPGMVTIKKGDPVWAMLDRTRKDRKEFHRGTVDDIMLVKDNIIIPHNYEFYYFILNKVKTKEGLLFDFDNQDEDVKRTKVVHRPWYEKNKHIYPASLWQEFDPETNYTDLILRDQHGFVYYKQR
ncbi:XAP5, circadian clock regulator-domain-containing protein [Dipodascopsis uninucleata]